MSKNVLDQRALGVRKIRHLPHLVSYTSFALGNRLDREWFEDDLLLKLDFRDPEPEVIDISPEGGVVSSLKESKIECLSAEKVRPARFILTFSYFCLVPGRLSVLFPPQISRQIPSFSFIH